MENVSQKIVESQFKLILPQHWENAMITEFKLQISLQEILFAKAKFLELTVWEF